MNEFTNNPIDITQLPKIRGSTIKGLNRKYITVLFLIFSFAFNFNYWRISTFVLFQAGSFSNTIWMQL